MQNRLERANPAHAGYCARYITRTLAEVAPLRRAFSFSQDFPASDWKKMRELLTITADEPILYDELPPMPDFALIELAKLFGIEEDEHAELCRWLPHSHADSNPAGL